MRLLIEKMKAEQLEVGKHFVWEMAHVLDFHQGKCRNIHGHTYELVLVLQGNIIPDTKAPDSGMVVDFSVVSQVVKKAVLEPFDHALLLWENSPWVARASEYTRVMLLPVQPTVENLLIDIVARLKGQWPEGVGLKEATLYETKRSFARWKQPIS